MDGPKLFPGKQTADTGLLSPFRMDGWMIEIIGFKLLTKGRDKSAFIFYTHLHKHRKQYSIKVSDILLKISALTFSFILSRLFRAGASHKLGPFAKIGWKCLLLFLP